MLFRSLETEFSADPIQGDTCHWSNFLRIYAKTGGGGWAIFDKKPAEVGAFSGYKRRKAAHSGYKLSNVGANFRDKRLICVEISYG